jgi:hypothetical protein
MNYEQSRRRSASYRHKKVLNKVTAEHFPNLEKEMVFLEQKTF